MEQFKQILLTLMFVLFIVPAISQIKSPAKSQNNRPVTSSQLSEFKNLTAQANLSFIFPPGFKEIKALNNEYFSFDYAMELPGKDFEIWFHIKPEKEDWTSYIHSLNKPDTQLA